MVFAFCRPIYGSIPCICLLKLKRNGGQPGWGRSYGSFLVLTDRNRTDRNQPDQNRTDRNQTDWNRTDQNQTDPNRTDRNRTGPNRSDIRGAKASHHGSWIMDHGPCFGMNGHLRRATDAILRLSKSTIEDLSFFIGFGSLSWV